jgi:hypothetical protein
MRQAAALRVARRGRPAAVRAIRVVHEPVQRAAGERLGARGRHTLVVERARAGTGEQSANDAVADAHASSARYLGGMPASSTLFRADARGTAQTPLSASRSKAESEPRRGLCFAVLLRGQASDEHTLCHVKGECAAVHGLDG